MSLSHRALSVSLGVLGLVIAWSVLGLVLCFALWPGIEHLDLRAVCEKLFRSMGVPQVLFLTAASMGLMTASAFLCVKAACAPPRFWAHSGRHLLMALVLAWMLVIIPFATFALMPK